LKRASGFLQREIGRVLKSRLTPKLVFVYDDTDIRGRNMSELIDSAIEKDKANSSE
ncbi:MAG: ribosome-binding factor A, partial [Rubritalea sp.]